MPQLNISKAEVIPHQVGIVCQNLVGNRLLFLNQPERRRVSGQNGAAAYCVARYRKMAPASNIVGPSASSKTGTLPFGFIAKKSAVVTKP